MPFCYQCGGALISTPSDTEQSPQQHCQACGNIHYHNPAVLVSVFLYHQDKLLLIKRGTEPSKGRWTFPAGFLERGESLQDAAVRELREETTIVLDPQDLIPLSLLSVLPMHQVYLSFRCQCDHFIEAQTTDEVEAWGWFSEEEAPWGEIAYNNAEYHIRQSYRWLKSQKLPICVGYSTAEKIVNKTYDY